MACAKHLISQQSPRKRARLHRPRQSLPRICCVAQREVGELRNAAARHEYQVSHAEFEEITSYFESPTAMEDFNIVTHRSK
jgi:hypothetical protein